MKPEHQDKINELIETMASTLRVTAQRLYYSGAINPDDYSADEYVLSKLLVTAALHQHKDDFAPRGQYRDDLKNLLHF